MANQLNYNIRCKPENFFNGYENNVFYYPFTDKRIIEFCLASPGSIKVHNGYKRYMIRLGMRGILPSKIRWRISKEPFSPDYHNRYNKQKAIALRILSSIKKSELISDIINIKKLKKQVNYDMKSNRYNNQRDFIAMHIVPMTVYLFYFLRQFK